MDRLMARVVITERGCWQWTGAKTPGGYGVIGVGKRARVVHRVAYETLVGIVPVGLELDHLCRNRACANPSHLEPVTRLENVRRGLNGPGSHRTHCIHGHEYTPENTVIKKRGTRECRACTRRYQREYWRQHRAPGKKAA
jgi:hypothetical protein